MKTKFLQLLPVLALLSGSPNAMADIGENMNKFWKGMGGISNYNGAGAYEGQAAGYYTLGGMHARIPVQNSQIASIQLPSIKAGCGGINQFNGGFSFLNSTEITGMLTKIAGNAKTFAMQLAIETVSPVIAEKMEELQSWAQKINAMNINSCETAAALVGGLWPRQEQASQAICSTLANGSGIADDYVQAKHGCNTDRHAIKEKIHKSDKNLYDQLMVEDINIAWKALMDSGFFSASTAGDKALAELVMTLSGTIIIKGADSSSGAKYEYISGRAEHNDVIQVLLEGGTIKHHVCSETEKCLNVTREAGSHSIAPSQAFKSKVEKLINQIVEKVKVDSALNDEEKDFINTKTGIPLYKILNVYAAYSGAGSLFELPAYSEAISLQMLYEYLDDVLKQADRASDALIIASDDHLKRFKESLREARRSLAQREIKTHQSYATLTRLVDRAMSIEGILSKQIGSPVAESFQWSKEY